ncbi:MAG: class I SAM-dependent methyltransferase [Methanobacteriaceae archaeon]|nr:class I SAM-dependent methyltransferase [Methanobacteriaceae archaeon]MDP2837013.1 class I SAM-dependent methyltransferase [Methanobacteriaceae archaeon]MDP3034815.1 class I SAM-dependent methyltransferase [Methanobacteriaceae archaeon]MDP3485795.1 class I SAM-dependent methyltransferase [Methanobacteriaceae archaeon]MDP3624438.1 class I SAM-dependent methyltransferase [Methanobacteriaceae archaeon]
MKKNPSWYYEEKQIGVDYLDSEIVKKYDNQHQKFRNFHAETEDMVEKLKITKEDVVLDFGCGTGEIALNLAKYSKKVICVDLSPEMLNILKTKAEKQNITNIEIHCGGFLSYKHEGEAVDKIVSKFALHHLPDFWKSIALLKMTNILKVSGKLYYSDVVFTFDPKDHENAINTMIEDLRFAAGNSMAHETLIHIKDEFSTYDWIMDGLFEKTGFSIDSKIIEGNFLTYICSKNELL